MKKSEKTSPKKTSASCAVRNVAKTRATADKSQLVGPLDEKKLNEDRRKNDTKDDKAAKGTCDSNKGVEKNNDNNEIFENIGGERHRQQRKRGRRRRQ